MFGKGGDQNNLGSLISQESQKNAKSNQETSQNQSNLLPQFIDKFKQLSEQKELNEGAFKNSTFKSNNIGLFNGLRNVPKPTHDPLGDLNMKETIPTNPPSSQDPMSSHSDHEPPSNNYIFNHKGSFSQDQKSIHKPIALKQDLNNPQTPTLQPQQDNHQPIYTQPTEKAVYLMNQSNQANQGIPPLQPISSTQQTQLQQLQQIAQQSQLPQNAQSVLQKLTQNTLARQVLDSISKGNQSEQITILKQFLLLTNQLPQSQMAQQNMDTNSNEDRKRGRPKKRKNPFVVKQTVQGVDMVLESWNIRKILRKNDVSQENGGKRGVRECACCRRVVKRHYCMHDHCEKPCAKQQSEDRMRKFYIKKKEGGEQDGDDKNIVQTEGDADDLNGFDDENQQPVLGDLMDNKCGINHNEEGNDYL